MKVKFKKLHPEAVTPSYAKIGDAGMDFTAISGPLAKSEYIEYETGIAVEIPEGHVGLMFPRSSVSKYHLLLANSVGVIDSGYRGPLNFRFKYAKHDTIYNMNFCYKKGDKIGQLIIVPYPQIELEEVTELSSTERGEGGWGSSGS